jgi:hypothetical protein
MSTPRLLSGLAALVFASGISVDPGVRATPLRPRAQLAVAEPAPAPAAPPGIALAEAPAPRDVVVKVTSDPRGGHRVVVERPGHLVSLRHEDARAAGKDSAAMRVEARPGRGAAEDRLIWESTRLDTLETTRGLVRLVERSGAITHEVALAAPPAAATSWKNARGSCSGQHDGLGGFTVLCRFAKGARDVGAANVTGARTLDDTWLVPGPAPVVRLDLARAPGSASGRVIGFSHGATGHVLLVEASFPEGEPPALVIHEATRAQPTPLF